jgi:hypothetical protein
MTAIGRPLTPGEGDLAQRVFGPALQRGPIRLVPGGFGRFAVTLGPCIFLPSHLIQADYALADVGAQALLVHELVHVWQFQTQPLRTVASWAKAVASGGYGPGLPAYCYGLPVGEFRRLGLERQASVVEHLFLLRHGWRSRAMPDGLRITDLEAVTPFPVTI